MTVDRRSLLAATGLALAAQTARAQTPPPGDPKAVVPGLPEPRETLDLWPNGAPGFLNPALAEVVQERSTDPQVTDRAVYGVSRPRLVVFRPAVPNGSAALIMPGGGYRWIVVDKEGYELGRWLAARGVTAFVLFYRLAWEGWAAGPDVSLMDAQRAIRAIRRHAGRYGVDPVRVAAIGFSAGGHVCADLGARFAAQTYAATDAADRLSPRPDFAAPLYPVVSMRPPVAHMGSRERLLGAAPSADLEQAHSPHENIPLDAPPHFLLHAEDDDVVPVENSLLLRAALKARGVAVETHLFAHGGHGFGLRRTAGKPVAAWPDLLLAWGRSQGWIV